MNTHRLGKGLLFVLACLVVIVLCGMGAPGSQRPGDACGTACGSVLFFFIAILVLNIALLVWVARDAKNRGMGNSVGWIFLVLFTGIIGLIIYLFSRPAGELVHCEICKNKRLKVANVCPHCGNSTGRYETKSSSSIQGIENKYCPNCGSTVSMGAAFCEKCGKRIKD